MGAVTMLLVPVPEAEAAIDPLRRRLDPSWRQGMPAHVTVLVPFLTPDRLSGSVVQSLQDLFDAVEPFDVALRRTGWFDNRVLYLAPEPAEPFRRMTLAVVERFPDHPPYGGEFADIVPHVTIAESGRWRKRRRPMRRAAGALVGMPPIVAHVSDVWLMELSGRAPRWRRTATFQLGRPHHPLLHRGRSIGRPRPSETGAA